MAMAELTTSDTAFHPCVTVAPPPQTACHFAPAGRDSRCEVARKTALLEDVPLLKQAIDAMPHMVLVLNEKRQIVAANEALMAALNARIVDVAAKRPGEAIGCLRAKDGPDGCGTGWHCVTCGAAGAIFESQREGKKVVRECRILVESGDAVAPMDLKVTASPFAVGNDRFTMTVIEDITQPKRLAVLQDTFLHDILNTAGCIRGYADYLASEGAEDPKTCKRIAYLTGQLIASIHAQRDLSRAEANDPKLHAELAHAPALLDALRLQYLHPELVHVPTFLDALRLQYCRHPVAQGRTIVVGDAWQGAVVTDRQLLQRVLENMLKNALEASAPGNTVTVDCEEGPDEVVFSVHNPEVIPAEVQPQLFQQSVSTKGESGRGIGTRSIKLLGERYLRGKVEFSSEELDGTTFTLTLPKQI